MYGFRSNLLVLLHILSDHLFSMRRLWAMKHYREPKKIILAVRDVYLYFSHIYNVEVNKPQFNSVRTWFYIKKFSDRIITVPSLSTIKLIRSLWNVIYFFLSHVNEFAPLRISWNLNSNVLKRIRKKYSTTPSFPFKSGDETGALSTFGRSIGNINPLLSLVSQISF